METAKALLAAGATVNESAADGSTPLMVATIRGQIPFATFLLDLGANPNVGTGIHSAALGGGGQLLHRVGHRAATRSDLPQGRGL